ncbi:MOSC domain-containing protein [Arcobacter sp. CECT 8989]|uniref:MOSC domain-containing protein n=1 Tax=Arcobacter sp. CECT 8989 TaxID=2044509 RepID=UPI00100A3F4E|nr:MOSC domain-containing protein [Arcobacter sp. CECT 8989]RXK02689.1 MOSC domain-containing protein [Arcobacter sp. CECT 8989]
MTIGKVVGTFSAKKADSGLPRPKVDSLKLIEGFGIEEDKFAGKDLEKTVMIVGQYSYDISLKEGINIQAGSLGENILFDFNPHDYSVGTKFKIGEAVIQITENCTICNHLAVFGKKLPKIVKDCRGIYCTIINNGVIKKDDSVELI